MAVGTANYELLPGDTLPAVPGDLSLVVDLFTGRLGYERVALDEARQDVDLTADVLRRGLSRWLRAPERRPSDVVTFYYCGHGAVEAGRHYLLATDSDPDDLVGSAFPSADLALMVAGSPVTGMLVVLDTCYSGSGAAETSAAAAGLDRVRPAGERPGSGLWLIASAGPKGEADQGTFARAFVRCILDAGAGQREPYVSPLDVVGAVNDTFAGEAARQWAEVRMGSAGATPRFLPNIRYRPDLPEGIDLEAQRGLRPEDLTAHWGPRARGVEVDAQPGWHFCGRTRALRELVTWLAGDGGDPRPRVVTGGPGSGKSAVLARIVILADPEVRDGLSAAGVATGTLPPAGLVDVAVHARGKSVEEVTAEIAAATGMPSSSPSVLADRLSQRRGRFVLVVDALDEASRPHELVTGLLRPLAGAAVSGATDLRLLVGTRHGLVGALGDAAVVDLDRPDYLDVADLASYAASLLAGEGAEPGPGLRRTAIAVAERAHPTFLVARLIVRSLVASGHPLDVTADELPATIEAAIDRDFLRFGADERRVRDLLRALAYAEGAGLPRRLWPALGGALSGRTYTDDDVGRVLAHAGSYLVEALDDHRRTVYRLYHRAFADVLTGADSVVEAQRAIASCLVERARSADAGRRWRDADPYLRDHLAAHAAAAGMLDDLLADPEFLICADPARLRSVLPAAGSDRTPGAAVYTRAAHLLREGTEGHRAAHLELIARQSGATELADAIAGVAVPRPWQARWTHWSPSHPHRVVGRHSGAVHAVAVGQVGDRPLVVSGGDDRRVRRWDPLTGEPLKVLKDHQEPVTALAIHQVDGRPVLSSSDRRLTRRWDLATGAPVATLAHFPRDPQPDPQPDTEAVPGRTARLTVDGHTWQVSGGDDGQVEVVEVGEAGRRHQLLGHSGAVHAVATGSVRGRPVLVSGGEDGTVRLWELTLDRPGAGSAVEARGVGIATSRDDRRLVVTVGRDGVSRWDLATGAQVGEPFAPDEMIEAIAVRDVGGVPMAVSVGTDGIQRWDVGSGSPIGPRLTGHGDTDLETRARAAGYDPEPRAPGWRQDPAPHVTAVAFGELHGRPVIVTGGYDKTVRRWDAVTGSPVGDPIGPGGPIWPRLATGLGGGPVWLPGHELMISAVAVGEASGRSVVVSVDFGGRLHRWDLAGGDPLDLDPPLQVHKVMSAPRVSVAVAAAGRSALILVAGADDRRIRCWDLATREPRPPLGGHRQPVTCLATGVLPGRDVVVSGDRAGVVHVWDLRTALPVQTIDVGAEPCALALAGTSLVVASTKGVMLVDLDP